MIIETSSNKFFRVREFNPPMSSWAGVPVKKVKGVWVPKTRYGEPERPRLVRKAATRIVDRELATEYRDVEGEV